MKECSVLLTKTSLLSLSGKHGPLENKEGGGPFGAIRPAIMDWRHECVEGRGEKVGEVTIQD